MAGSKPIREIYGQTLVELGRENPDVVVLDADVSNSTRSVLFAEEFPERFFNLGIAEANMMSVAAGMAASGKIPFANTFSFLATLKAGDPVRSLIALNSLNVKIAGCYAGFSDSYDGASHQSVMDCAVMRSLPNMTVVVVGDPVETVKATKAAAAYPGPVYLRLSRAPMPEIHGSDYPFRIGTGVLLREGRDLAVVATGCMVSKALVAAQELAAEGISARIIEIHTLKPLDEAMILAAARETGRILTAEEHSVIGGLGSAVAEVVCRHQPVSMEFVGINDTFGESGEYEALLAKHGLSTEHIVAKARHLLGKE